VRAIDFSFDNNTQNQQRFLSMAEGD
jgi:hypothetical protein